MSVKLNLIAAVSENMGIGKNNTLPWRLKSEMEYFTRMTTETNDSNKQNIVIMGRKTWDSIPNKYKPLNKRINFVLSRSQLNVDDYENVHAFNSFDSVLEKLNDKEFFNVYERAWIIGGSYLYKEAMLLPHLFRLYLTRIMKDFDCDTFFPELNPALEKIKDTNVSEEIQEEKGIKFKYEIYENTEYKE